MDIQNQVTCDHRVGNPVISYEKVKCPKCKGLGVYGSIGFSGGGGVEFVKGPNMLVQQLKKLLTERRRSSGYGFDYSVLSGVIDDSKLMAIKNEIIRCLSYYKSLQQQNKLNGFYYNPDEEIYSIDTPSITQDSVDLRKVGVSLNVYSISGLRNNISIQVTK